MVFEGFAKGLSFPIEADTSGLKKGLAETDTELTKTESRFGAFTTAIKGNSKEIALGMTAVGISIVALTDDAKKTNAEFAGTAITLGTTTEAIREMALATSDAGFPLDDVTATFDLLARAGVRGDEQLQAISKSMDTLGDATGNSAATVTSSLIPALNAFDIPLEQVGDHIDGLTYLTKNSTIELSDFTSTMSTLGPKLNDMGLSMEDAEAIMLSLNDAGYQGAAATKAFRSAVGDSKGDVDALYTSLGITKESVTGYKTEIESAGGLTQKYADAADSAIGTTDKVKNVFDELKLSAGSMLEPLDGVGAALSIGGPMLLGLTQLPMLIGGVNTAMIFLAANPIVLVIAAVAALVLGLIYLETQFGVISKTFKALGEVAGVVWEGIVATMKWAVNIVIDGINTMIRGLNLLNFSVPSWVPLIGGQSIGFHLSEIPRLAAGGIVTQPTIAMIGEAGPEAVVPLTGSNAGGKVGGDIVFKDCTFTGNEEQIARNLYTLIGRQNRGRGAGA
jgi:methyl-accepting chemotaxis protein